MTRSSKRSAADDIGPMTTRAGLHLELTTSPHSPLLEDFYVGYDRSFVLPNEKEMKEGFAVCMALNEGEAYRGLSERLGAFREVIVVAREGPDAGPVGGANFIAYPLAGGTRLALNLNYLYVLPEQRRKGHFSRLVASVAEVARRMWNLDDAVETLLFIEQNDPLKMSLADYQRDTAHSGLDQVERLHMWARLGALIVDFPYVQPALSAEQEADDTLLYSVLGARSDTLDACLLLAHLERFFSISVLKGQPLASSPAAQSQIDVLRKSCAAQGSVRLLAPQAAIQRLRESREELAKTANSTRDLARE